MQKDGLVDYYRVLGVPRSASLTDIKRAYRRLALVYHPDRKGDATQIVLINEAYAVLKDGDKRAKYDVLHTLHFGAVGAMSQRASVHLHNIQSMVKKFNHVKNLDHHRRHLANLVKTRLQKNATLWLKNATVLLVKLNHQVEKLQKNAHLTTLLIDERVAKLGGQIYFDDGKKQVQVSLPKGLASGMTIQLMIDGVPTWFLIKVKSDHKKGSL